MPERYDSIIHKLLLKGKKTIKTILSSITRIGLIVCMEDSKEAPGVDHVYVEEDTEVEETTVADIVTTGHPVGNNAIFAINLDASQASI